MCDTSITLRIINNFYTATWMNRKSNDPAEKLPELFATWSVSADAGSQVKTTCIFPSIRCPYTHPNSFIIELSSFKGIRENLKISVAFCGLTQIKRSFGDTNSFEHRNFDSTEFECAKWFGYETRLIMYITEIKHYSEIDYWTCLKMFTDGDNLYRFILF